MSGPLASRPPERRKGARIARANESLRPTYGDALGAMAFVPVAAGLSPDAAESGVFVAILAAAALLFLAAQQRGRRRDRWLAAARDAESVARFK